MAMNVVPRHRLYLSALSILFVVSMLLIFISISTYWNLNRERNAAVQTVRNQALTLINAFEAGARAGMMMQRHGKDTIVNLVHEIGRSGDVDYLYLANGDGEVTHHSIPSLEGTRALWRPVFKQPGDIQARMRRLADGSHVFEVAKPFTPMSTHVDQSPSSAATGAAKISTDFHPSAIIYLGMAMTSYETARRSDLQHAIIMGAIVLALGGGVIYFFVVIRSYYLLSRDLQETRDYTRQVIASMVHGVLSIDAGGMVVSSNRQALSLLDLPPDSIGEIDLQTVFDFKETGIDRTLKAGIPVMNREIEFRHRSGDSLPLLITVTPIHDDTGKHSGAVVVLRDMSEIKRLEEKVRRAEKLAAIGQLAAGVAHEIRNPLSSIRGFAYLLGRGYGTGTSEREYADVMVREIDRINHVVADLLNFARPMALEPVASRITDIIDHVISLVSADAKENGIDIRVDVESDLQPMMLDPNMVTQALLNLMLNALHALDKGGTITIRVSSSESGKGVRFQVEDDGAGIDPAMQDKIFDPFYTTRERGTGLGLAIVRKIAENHDGHVEVESPPPGETKGTCVTLLLKSMDG